MSAQPNVLLGVCGGIAAYKTAELTRRLIKQGANVQVVMTANAERFITPLTLQALSGNAVRTSLWDHAAELGMGHIELARWADLVVIAPASADCLARLATGQCNDLLTTLCLATTAPILVAPAMNTVMWEHPATRANMQTLAERGVSVVGPGVGELAERESGPGRMSEPSEIVEAINACVGVAAADGPMRHRGVLITAGPTREPLDPVRFLTNRSSGKMGFAVAAACAALGAEVTLVAGPVSLPTPRGVTRIDVETAQQMHEAVLDQLPEAEVFIATAAVADYRTAEVADAKIKKSAERQQLELVRNTDILADVAQRYPEVFTVGFAAETDDLEGYARGKLEAKRLDMIAANWVGNGRGFDTDDNALWVAWDDGEKALGPAPKTALARALVELIANRLDTKFPSAAKPEKP